LGVPGGICLLWAAVAFALDRYGERRLPEDTVWDAIVVPGAAVWPDGQPSPALARRVREACRLWRAHKAPLILISGGIGRNPPSEAEVGARIAAAEGVPIESLILEDRSTSTEENARFSRDLVPKLDRVLVTTDNYHAWRSGRVFARHFPQVTAVGSRPGPRLRLRGALREVFVILVYAVKGRL